MSREEVEDTNVYKVVVNHEEQYSIWPSYKDNPLGWKDAGKDGTKAECLDYIQEVWTDMRPLSLRKHMEEMEKQEAHTKPDEKNGHPVAADKPDDLVQRLADGSHPVEVSLRPEPSVAGLKDRLELGYVHIKFTDTKGGTELGVQVDTDTTNLADADFEQQVGKAHIVGGLTLNYTKVRCVADIDLATLKGEGHLELVEA